MQVSCLLCCTGAYGGPTLGLGAQEQEQEQEQEEEMEIEQEQEQVPQVGRYGRGLNTYQFYGPIILIPHTHSHMVAYASDRPQKDIRNY